MTGKIFFNTDIGEQPLVMTEAEYNDSFMKETVDYAIERFNKIDRHKPKTSASSIDAEGEISQNNVIAFVGDRGTGKTSCMLSVVNILQERERRSESKNYFMEMLDPSFFDEEHTILDILIGQLYAAFYSYSQHADQKRNNLIRDLVDDFKEVKDCLKFLGKSIDHDNDSLEELRGLAVGVQLKKAFRNLVEKLCQLFDTKRLVIPIDDIDLNTQQAFKMMELIRKYIMQDNTILLFAVKIPQLTNAVKLELSRQYAPILGREKHMTDADVAVMADRYVEKLIPIEGRVFMPDGDAILSRPLVVDRPENEYPVAGEAVPWLIFAKTRYLFYNTEGTYSRIIPRRLRELRQLVMLLYNLPDYDSDVSMYSDTEAGRQNNYNKSTFKNYFFNAIADALPATHRNIAEAIYNHRDYATFNKNIIELLNKFTHKVVPSSAKEEIESDRQTELSLIVAPENQPYNISTGDVMLYLDNLSKYSEDAEMQTLIFFVKSLYSIRLYELYDLRADVLEEGNPAQELAKPRLQNQLLTGIDDYSRLVGGSYITLTSGTFLPYEGSNMKIPRERKKIDGEKIREKIREVLAVWSKIEDRVTTSRKEGTELDADTIASLEEMVKTLRTIEFFMLCTQRYIPSESYRQAADVFYTRSLENVGNLLLDITAPLFTLQDIRRSYNRFDKRIFEVCTKLGVAPYRSLYSELMSTEDGSLQSFLSNVTIRNVEILEDLYDFVRRHRDGRNRDRQGRSLCDIYATFYQTLAEYRALTYPKTSDIARQTDYHTISLTPIGVFFSFLRPLPGAEPGVDMALFAEIAESADVEHGKIQLRSSYTRKYFRELIESNYPEVLKNADVEKRFNNVFMSETKKYGTAVIIEKLARISTQFDIVFTDIFEEGAASDYLQAVTNIITNQ